MFPHSLYVRGAFLGTKSPIHMKRHEVGIIQNPPQVGGALKDALQKFAAGQWDSRISAASRSFGVMINIGFGGVACVHDRAECGRFRKLRRQGSRDFAGHPYGKPLISITPNEACAGHMLIENTTKLGNLVGDPGIGFG